MRSPTGFSSIESTRINVLGCNDGGAALRLRGVVVMQKSDVIVYCALRIACIRSCGFSESPPAVRSILIVRPILQGDSQ